MILSKKVVLFSMTVALIISQINAAVDPNFHIYLLFGQSNMAGPCNNDNAIDAARDPQPKDCDTTSRVKVLAWGDYSRASKPCGYMMNRTHDQWYTAYPPYHNQSEGLGPADYFGKTLLDSIRDDISIGFVPCALSGEKIEVFMKGKNAAIDGFTQPTIGNNQKLQSGGYEWMVKRAKLAQESGVIKGILLHQGEANSGEGDAWVTKVKGIVADLKADLKLGDIPFIAGELIQDPAADQSAKNLNPYVNKLKDQITKCGVASSKDFKVRPGDTYKLHFDCASVREFGRRYAREFLKLADNDWVPRKGTVNTINGRPVMHQAIKSATSEITVYTLNGKVMRSYSNKNSLNALHSINAGGVYIVSRKLSDGRTAIVPMIKE